VSTLGIHRERGVTMHRVPPDTGSRGVLRHRHCCSKDRLLLIRTIGNDVSINLATHLAVMPTAGVS